MASFFPWKRGEGDKGKEPGAPQPGQSGQPGQPGGGSSTPAPAAPKFSPDKATKFFERAVTVHETGNHTYAMDMWLGGLRQDPTSMSGLEGFFKSAGAYMNAGGKGTPKDVLAAADGKEPLDKFLRAILEWSTHPADPAYAIKALESAAYLGLADAAVWIGLRAMGVVSRDKKPRKDHYVAIMEAMRKFEKYDMAVEAGEAAVRVDPTDAKLAALIRNLSAESTMTKGGFDQAGKEGGFRANVRDAAKQQSLDEENRIVKTSETVDRLVAAAKADYEANKLDRPNIVRYLDRLLERGTPEDEAAAVQVASDAYKATQEYRFLERAETVRLRQVRRRVAKLKAAAEAPDATDEARKAFRSAAKEYLELEASNLESQVKQYPTDLLRKFEYGKRLYQLGRYEEAIGQLQEAKADVKNRAEILHLLGNAFVQIGWLDEAVQTHRQALEAYSDPSDNKGMELRYGLMAALQARASEQSDLANAEEANKIASSIAIQQINYKDVRQKREELKQLITKLKAGTPSV